MARITIKKGDEVQIIAGRDKGKRGTVEKVFPKEAKVVISGLNMIKRHMKPSKSQPRGGIVEKPAAIARSKVMPICPETTKPTRVRHTITENGIKYRSSQYGDISLDSK